MAYLHRVADGYGEALESISCRAQQRLNHAGVKEDFLILPGS